ncbi:cytochrome b5 [Xylocopa sonorina]|uniref:cytochrome b5 n=1 Tax=Xylocopa sonorina TaxID=1818115 RepID=UPI00403B3030
MSKQYTRNEVASMNGKERTLIILHDKVFDVTKFLNEHPGGEEILLDHGGKDASDDFNDVGHSIDALDLSKTYLVGELVESERANRTPKYWSASKKTTETKTQEKSNSTMMMVAIGAVLFAIVYFVYL